MIKLGEEWVSVDHIVAVSKYTGFVGPDKFKSRVTLTNWSVDSGLTLEEVVELIAECREQRQIINHKASKTKLGD